MNMTANPQNRPLIFKTEAELEERIEEYFTYVEKKGVAMTTARLAVFLGIHRNTLIDYGKREKYYHIIERTKALILADKEERLNSLDGNKTGIIFDLKNNEKYSDKTETEISNKSGESFKIDANNMTDEELNLRILELTAKS